MGVIFVSISLSLRFHDSAGFNDPFFVAAQSNYLSHTNYTKLKSANQVLQKAYGRVFSEIKDRELVVVNCTLAD